MTQRLRMTLLAIVIGLALNAMLLLLRVHPLVEVADTADQLHLKLIAQSIYEYRTTKGRWPTRAEDLLETTLPATAPHDVGLIRTGPYVVVWPQDLDPDPRKNGGRLLVYTLGGPARRGWVWVCWGDFRTEYLSPEQFQAILAAEKK